jgi:hypothetical protein
MRNGADIGTSLKNGELLIINGELLMQDTGGERFV